MMLLGHMSAILEYWRIWFCISLFLIIMVIGLRKLYTKTAVGMDLVMFDVNLKIRNVEIRCRLPVFRIKIPGICVQDHKYRNGNVQTITQNNESLAQNMQSWNKQNVQYKISRDRHTIEAQEELKGKFLWRPRGTIRSESTQIRRFLWQSGVEAGPHEGWPKTLKRGYQARVQSDHMVLMMARQGSLDHVSSGQNNQGKLNLVGDYQARVHSGQMVLVLVRQGGRTAWVGAKDTQKKVGKRL